MNCLLIVSEDTADIEKEHFMGIEAPRQDLFMLGAVLACCRIAANLDHITVLPSLSVYILFVLNWSNLPKSNTVKHIKECE